MTRLSFGRLDAETDDILVSSFVETGVIDDLRDGKCLVIGRKGSGKTALFRHYAATAPIAIAELDLDAYVWEFHRGFTESGLPSKFAYTASWKLLFYLAAYSVIRHLTTGEERRSAEAAFRRLGIGQDRNRIAAMAGWLARVRKVSLPEVTGVFAGGSLEVDPPTEPPLSPITAEAISDLERVLAGIYQRAPFVVLVDRLDDGWDETQAARDLITGAIRATREASIRLQARTLAPVVLFLREDLWDRVRYNDRSKIGQDVVFLNWHDYDLKRILERRITSSMSLGTEEALSAVFEAQATEPHSVPNFIVSRSLRRPRDVISFANLALDQARKNHHAQISHDDALSAETAFSRRVFEEFQDAYENHIPQSSILKNTLRSLSRVEFTAEEWLSAAASYGRSKEDAEMYLDALVEYSLVGIRFRTSSPATPATYRYHDREILASADCTFVIHPSILPHLGIADD